MTIVATKYPIEPPQADLLRTMFASPAYTTLKEILAAHCAFAQVEYSNRSCYENENAQEQASSAQKRAVRLRATLDVLDDIEGKMEEWFRIKLEPK